MIQKGKKNLELSSISFDDPRFKIFNRSSSEDEGCEESMAIVEMVESQDQPQSKL